MLVFMLTLYGLLGYMMYKHRNNLYTQEPVVNESDDLHFEEKLKNSKGSFAIRNLYYHTQHD